MEPNPATAKPASARGPLNLASLALILVREAKYGSKDNYLIEDV
jgi:hypothetical protein